MLVAGVVATMMAVVLISISACAWLMVAGGVGGVCTSLQDFAQKLIEMSFTAAVAFAAGKMSAPQPPQPKLPPEDSDEVK